MNELKWYWAFDPYLDPPEKQKESALKAGYVKVVCKSDADKVIEEKDKKIAEKDKEIAELKKEKEYVIEHTTEVINGQERELRHRKRKWCLAMAKWCKRKRIDAANYIIPREMWVFYDKWHKRWLAIAEKFKEAK